MDALSELLSSMRLAGGVFLDGEMAGPWSVISYMRDEEAARFFGAPTSYTIAYHYVRGGWLNCQIGDEPPVRVNAGEIVILPRNVPHFLHGPEPGPPVDGNDIIETAPDGMFRVRIDGDGEKTAIYCGFLGSTTPQNMLLQQLPAIMVIGLDDAADSAWIKRSLDFAVQGLSKDSPEMVGKLAEGLFAEAVRRYIDALPPEGSGWLAGLKDSAVGRTITMIHSRFAEALTLDELAREAGVSKTVLGDRFRALLGETPMQYCAKWRMHVAADMLRHNRQNACSVAYAVGFNSEAAFNRAFKRENGLPPAAWQRLQSAA